MKNILYITNLYPHDDNPMSGIYITRRLEQISKNDFNINAIGTVIKYNENISKLIYKFTKKKITQRTTKNYENNSYYKYIHYELNIFDYFFRYFNNGLYNNSLAKGFMKSLEKEINIKDYDLVHAHPSYPTGYTAYLLKKKYSIPYVLTAHGSDIHTNPKSDNTIKKYTLKALDFADRVIFVSNRLLEQARELGYKKNHNIVIPNGVDIDKFTINDKLTIRKKLGLSLGSKYVGFVGSFKPVKNVQLFPDIFYKIKNQNGNVKFLLIGDGELRKDVEQQCKRKNLDVYFTGMIPPDDVPVWMNAMDLLILPSKNEGFPNVVIEAQACGLPVIGSDAGGIPEAIGGNEYGRIVELGENFEERFANAIIELLSNTPNAEFIRSRALNYSWSNIVRREEDVYNKVIEKYKHEY